jgi:hypothetical protein
MFKLYRKSQEAQLTWIRNHPVQYIALNTIIIAALFGYWEYKDRQKMREIKNEIAQKEK